MREEKRMAKYHNIIFQMRRLAENVIKKILNAFPNIDIVRGGGRSAYNSAFARNQMSVGIKVYAKVKINGLILMSF